ncbi:hypothetical protein KDL01_09975 [Actinospica durhamensis]|uniref:Uncharacterized protein n=1 Tax=Actinospica durhamensis TaxID=1508375 RepID=A0A941IN53_9ACTN|nr:hypothetical protein [Actinospica durhamensis]MBR7833594.1 hypothetical protein [Actinospica durhamensis]
MNSTTQLRARKLAPAQMAHPVHGLVAIANGPDYCLCGNLWPCRPIELPAVTAR